MTNLHVLKPDFEKQQEEVEQTFCEAMAFPENIAQVVIITVDQNGDIDFYDSNVSETMKAFLALALQHKVMNDSLED